MLKGSQGNEDGVPLRASAWETLVGGVFTHRLVGNWHRCWDCQLEYQCADSPCALVFLLVQLGSP